MANTYTKHTVIDGTRNLVVNIHGLADGVGGNETDLVLVDASTYSPAYTKLKVMKVCGNASDGVIGRLIHDGSSGDEPFFEFSQGEFESDWTNIGGVNNANVTGPTGDILLTSLGFDAAGDQFQLTIWIKKVFSYAVGLGDAESHAVPGQSQAGNPSGGTGDSRP